MEFGILLGDETLDVDPRGHLDILLRTSEAAQRNGFRYIAIGQHFLYDGYRWMQPVPLLARLTAELDSDVTLCTTVLIGPLHNPIALAEELATLDILTGGRLVVGIGSGYLRSEYEAFGIPFEQRYSMLEELLALLPTLWTSGRVSFDGSHFSLNDVPTHLRPLQEPHPPVWVGAMGVKGVRRAARLADRWSITPQQTIQQVAELMGEYAAERRRLSLPLEPLPLRRELMLGKDADDALVRFQQRAQSKYIAYADRDLKAHTPAEVKEGFASTVRGHALLGTPEDCRQEISRIAATVPVEPLIVRPHWPGMSAQEAVAYLDEVGEQIVGPLSDLKPCTFEQAVPRRPAQGAE